MGQLNCIEERHISTSRNDRTATHAVITGSLPHRVCTHATLKFLQRCANKRYSTMQSVTRLSHSDDRSNSPFL